MSDRARSNTDPGLHDEALSLDVLDPGHADPQFWYRFQTRVMYLAGPELARRAVRQPTVGDVLASWWRLLLPASVVAAAAMAIFLMPADTAVGTDLALEEALVLGFDDEPLPAVLVSEQVDEVAFLVAIEGTVR